jgi:excinuclease ABC subunit C
MKIIKRFFRIKSKMKINQKKIPKKPGCYLFKDKFQKIIYIGKAKNLKKRVNSYFQKKDHNSKNTIMISQIDSVDFFITENDIEALILENNLIKNHKPKYNIDLKDSKRYAYIELTTENYPRLIIARHKREKGKFFGPFVSAEKRDYILKILNKTFKLRTCKKLPKKPCLKKHIDLCIAPCNNNCKKEYSDRVQYAELVLKGKIKDLSKKLKKNMELAASKKEFEKALEFRNQLQALSYLTEKQKVERKKTYNEDIINFLAKRNTVYLMLFNIYKGILENKQVFTFPYSDEFLEEFLVQYYSENEIPERVIIPREIDKCLTEFLNLKNSKKKSSFIVPRIGELKQLLDLVKKNIEITFFGETEKLEELKKVINLQETPYTIECFDVSHLSGTSCVGSMVQFNSAKPDKKNYRKFKIRTVEGNNDFASIAEIVHRRYNRLLKEGKKFPDLIVIDGGLGQLNSALKELRNLNIKIPIISIAKEFEEIYIPGKIKPLRLNKKNKALQLVQQIRDEAHRFAINYQRLLQRKLMFK